MTFNQDVRDSQKISTLPDDLREIANQLLEKKFGLATQGEVVDPGDIDPKASGDAEKPCMEPTDAMGTSTEAASPFKDFTSDPLNFSDGISYSQINLTSADLAKASQALNLGKRVTNDGVSLVEWLEYWFSDAIRWRGYSHVDFTTKGMYSGNKYTKSIDPYRLCEFNNPKYAQHIFGYMKHILNDMQRDYLEPLIILDPRKYN